MFDLMTLEKFVPLDFRPTTSDNGDVKAYEKPPTLFYRVPTVLEAAAYGARVARLKDDAKIDGSDKEGFLKHPDTPDFLARECASFIVRVENISKDGQPVDWSALSEDAKKDLLMRLGINAFSRFWTLVSLAGSIFTGLTADEKKSSGPTSS